MGIKNYEQDGKKYYEVYVNGFDSIGRRVQKRKKGIDSLPKAKTVEFELKRELVQLKENAVPYSWEEWFSVFISRMKLELKPSTIFNYESQVNKWVTSHLKGVKINDITKSMIHEILFQKCTEFRTENNRKAVWVMLKKIFEMAFHDGLIKSNPCIGIKVKVPEPVTKVLTNSEAQYFLQQAKSLNHKFYPIWTMALFTGMRSGELFALKWSDIDLEGKTISVTKQWTSKNENGIGPTKGRRNRIVPISDELVAFLKEYKLQRGDEEFVLPHLRDWVMGEQARVTRLFCKGIGVTMVKFHDLRATFITNLLARGVSLAQVMSIVGHAELKTTNGYLRKAGVEAAGATEKLGYKMPIEESSAKVLNFSLV